MAHPKYHTIPTAALAIAAAATNYPEYPNEISGYLILAGILFFGIFFDIDHVSPRTVRQYLGGNWDPEKNWVNYLHTWTFFIAFLALTLILFLCLNYQVIAWAFASYLAHTLVDGANRQREYKNNPVAYDINRFYPRWLTYYFVPE